MVRHAVALLCLAPVVCSVASAAALGPQPASLPPWSGALNVSAAPGAGNGSDSAPFGLSPDTLARVESLWREVERDSPVQVAHTTTELRDFTEADVAPPGLYLGPFDQRPFQRRAGFGVTGSSGDAKGLRFPPGFIYGVATAAAQVEGAVKDDGRGPSIWDWFGHRTKGMANGDTFDTAVNFRYLYPLDLARVARMGVKAYSFSLSWSRVIPLGVGEVSQAGLQFYRDLVAEIRKHGMKPSATLFHWDVPLALELDYGSFTSPRIADDFAAYASLVFRELGAAGVRDFVTFNEPTIFCNERYVSPWPSIHGLAEGEKAPRNTSWLCSGHLLKAHGRAYEIFDAMRRNGTLPPDATLSFKSSGAIRVPYDVSSQADWKNVDRQADFHLGVFCDPIFGDGNYPKAVRDEVPREWLPELTEEDQKRLAGSADVFLTDYYSSQIAQSLNEPEFSTCVGNTSHPRWPKCNGPEAYRQVDGWPLAEAYPDETGSSWLSATPSALRYHLRYLSKRWPARNGIIVTEFGWAEKGEQNKTTIHELLMDTGRQAYYTSYLEEMLRAVHEDGVDLRGAYLWSATTVIEWESGFAARLGLQSVNITDPLLPRTFLGSFLVVRDFFARHLTPTDSRSSSSSSS